MTLLNFRNRPRGATGGDDPAGFLQGYSLEVMPRTLAKIDDIAALLAPGTRVYIAHIDGTPIDDMLATAKRLAKAGYEVMPHFPARLIPNIATLNDWIARYQGEAGVSGALVLAGGLTAPRGDFSDSMQLIDTGAFDRAGFKRLHIAGHPEGNRDIDPDGGTANTMAALAWKQRYRDRTDASMAIVTQFCFEAAPVIAWDQALRRAGIDMPVHIGVAGPAKLQTMIKFAIACGVGPSIRVLQRRARDVSRLVTPFEPTDFLRDLGAHCRAHPESLIAQAHFFPLGGIAATVGWARDHAPQPQTRRAQ